MNRKINIEDINFPEDLKFNKEKGIVTFYGFCRDFYDFITDIITLIILILFLSYISYSLCFNFHNWENTSGWYVVAFGIIIFILSIFKLLFYDIVQSKVKIDSKGITVTDKDNLKSVFIEKKNIDYIRSQYSDRHFDIVVECKEPVNIYQSNRKRKKFRITHFYSSILVNFLIQEINIALNSSSECIENLDNEANKSSNVNNDNTSVKKIPFIEEPNIWKQFDHLDIIENKESSFIFERKSFPLIFCLLKYFFLLPIGFFFILKIYHYGNISFFELDKFVLKGIAYLFLSMFIIVFYSDIVNQYKKREIKVSMNFKNITIEEDFIGHRIKTFNIKELNAEVVEKKDINNPNYKNTWFKVILKKENFSFELLRGITKKEADYIVKKIAYFAQ